MNELVCAVDSLVVKDRALFGFGWVFHQQQRIKSIRLRLAFAGQAVQYIAVEMGKPREDVQRAFPEQSDALHSGYVVFGAFAGENPLNAIVLECTLADNTLADFVIPSANIQHLSPENPSVPTYIVFRQYLIFLKRAWALIRAGKFGTLIEKIKRYIAGRPKEALIRPADLAGVLRSDERQKITVMIDHDLGGGANHYRNREVSAMIDSGLTVLILTYHVATLTYMLIIRNSRLDLRYAIPTRSFFSEAVKNLPVNEIIYNTAVSFTQPEDIPQLLLGMKQQTSARLKVLVHDFYMVCPSQFLLDHQGAYCNIPDVQTCARCLPHNREGFVSLFAERDIAKWRSLWGALLVSADEIVTFSHNTADLLHKAYPLIDRTQIAVRPHKVDHLGIAAVQVTQKQQLTIGVVGQIGFHKGARFVQQLAEEIHRRNADIRIVVVGSIEVACLPNIVSQTGTYQPHQLKALIEKAGANVMLFPSIWPETFSYVVHELINLCLPIASFNLGAPTERLKVYSKGMVLDSMDPACVLDQLISFHQKIYYS